MFGLSLHWAFIVRAQISVIVFVSEFICIGGWEEFTPTIVIDYPIHSASSYNDYSGYNFYEVSINSGKVHSFLKQCFLHMDFRTV